MKLHVLSDLHLEFAGHAFAPPATDADVVLLAGDIDKHTRGFAWACATFPGKPMVYVLGNHEFYGGELHGLTRQARQVAAEAGVHLLDNDAVVIEGVRFLGATLWTDFKLFGGDPDDLVWTMQNCKNGITDYLRIAISAGRRRGLLPLDTKRLHTRSRSWLERQLGQAFEGPTVVVTHHLPSLQSVPQRYRKDPTSAAFASPLDALIARHADAIALWIHGHTHDACDYTLHGVRVLCNPRGYPDEGCTGFRPDCAVEVDA